MLGRAAAGLYLWNWHMAGVRYLDCSMGEPCRTVWDMGGGYVFCTEDRADKNWSPDSASRPTLIGQYAYPDFRDAGTRGCLREMVEINALPPGEHLVIQWVWENGSRVGCMARTDGSGVALHPNVEPDELHALVAALATAGKE